jgi:hypothetical protein
LASWIADGKSLLGELQKAAMTYALMVAAEPIADALKTAVKPVTTAPMVFHGSPAAFLSRMSALNCSI